MAAPKILIVEGDAEARDVHRDQLEAAGFDVHAVQTASQCIAVVRKLRPQLIVMERKLPDGDGWELARVIKGMASTAYIKVIGISAAASHAEAERALATRCDVYLATPLRPGVLLAQVQRLLGPNPSTPPPLAAM